MKQWLTIKTPFFEWHPPVDQISSLGRFICLSEVWIQDARKRLPKLVLCPDYYLLLLVHAGTNDTANRDPGHIKSD